MKKIFMSTIILAILLIGCATKEEVKVIVDGKTAITDIKTKSVGDTNVAVIQESYKWAVDLIKAEAQKNGIMVDAFELREAEVQYLSPAKIMNAWDSQVKLVFRYALKEKSELIWQDLDAAQYKAEYGYLARLNNDHKILVNKIKGKFCLEDSVNILNILNAVYSQKTWMKK